MNTGLTEGVAWQLFDQPDEVAEAATMCIETLARKAIAAENEFRIVLAGGSTPRRVYERLAALRTDWEKWRIFFGDERCLPAEDPERNSVMAAAAWLDKVAIPESSIHVIPAEIGAEEAAHSYAEQIKSIGSFHLVLLGLGEDGHTASLFPGHEHPWPQTVVAVHNAPKPPPDRVSMGVGRLLDSEQVLFLVTGTSKQAAVRAWRQGANLPVTRISAQRPVTVYLDQAAVPVEMNHMEMADADG